MEKEYNFKIYGLSSSEEPENIRYIGLTYKTLEKRLKIHLWNSKKWNNYRCNWIKSVLTKNNKVIITLIEDSIKTKQEACEKEIHYIKLFKSFGAKLVNATKGGEITMIGKKLSPENKLNISKGTLGRGIKSIDQYDLKGNFIKTWKSITETSKKLKIHNSHITGVCKGNKKTAGGFIFKYEKEKLNLNEHEHKLYKKIIQYDKCGNFIKEWANAVRAGKELNIEPGQISGACNGRNKTAHDFIFKYKEDKLNLNDHNGHKKPVNQYDRNGNFIKHWRSIREAGEILGINPSQIGAVCKGKKLFKFAGGFIWKYQYEEVNLDDHKYEKHINIPILQYSTDGVLLGKYKNLKESSEKTNINKDSIRKTCNGDYKTGQGYIWKYEGDKLNLDEHINRKRLIQLDLNNNFIKEWNSLREASTKIGGYKSQISNCCLGKSKTAYGYKWKYKKLEENELC